MQMSFNYFFNILDCVINFFSFFVEIFYTFLRKMLKLQTFFTNYLYNEIKNLPQQKFVKIAYDSSITSLLIITQSFFIILFLFLTLLFLSLPFY